jgi:hypothetical protein
MATHLINGKTITGSFIIEAGIAMVGKPQAYNRT